MSALESLQHDVARATALSLTHVIQSVLRQEEVSECQRQFYQVLRASLEAYEANRQATAPIKPSAN